MCIQHTITFFILLCKDNTFISYTQVKVYKNKKKRDASLSFNAIKVYFYATSSTAISSSSNPSPEYTFQLFSLNSDMKLFQ